MGDLICRQAAIEAINKALDRQTLLNRFVRKVAIDAIKQLPPAQPSTGDCWGCNCPKMERLAQPAPSQVAADIARIVGNENDMRVIGQERIRGHWVPVGGALYQCDQCGAVSLERKFCSDCGADMREVTT